MTPMKDGRIRRLIKRLARWRYETDLYLTRRLQAWRGEEPRLELRGHCNGCGGCCETPMIHVPRLCFHLKTVRWAILTWQRLVNGFEYLGQDRLQHAYIFRCTHYDPQTKRCDSYDSRPGMCRDYPRNLLAEPSPEFLPTCSYYAYAINAAEIRQSLAELDLPPEKWAELERRFFIAEPPAAGHGGCGCATIRDALPAASHDNS